MLVLHVLVISLYSLFHRGVWGTVNIYIARGVFLVSSRCFANRLIFGPSKRVTDTSPALAGRVPTRTGHILVFPVMPALGTLRDGVNTVQ
jgi:hypothetical protein